MRKSKSRKTRKAAAASSPRRKAKLTRPLATLALDLNEKVAPPPADLVSFLRKQIPAALGYTRPELLATLKNKLADVNKLKATNVVIFPSSLQALLTIFNFLFQEGEEILLLTPTFSFYADYEHLDKFRLRKLPWPSGKNPGQEIIKELHGNTKAIYISNPSNPLGQLLSRKEIETIVAFASRRRILVLLDEAYFEFAGLNSSSLLKKYSNLIIIRTFSKAQGLAGLRIAYLLADTVLAYELEALRGPAYAVSQPGVLAAQWSLDNPSASERYVRDIIKIREDFCRFCQRNKIPFLPSRASFVAIKVKDSAVATKYLAEDGILVKNLTNHPDGAEMTRNWLRIAMPPRNELRRLEQALLKLVKQADLGSKISPHGLG